MPSIPLPKQKRDPMMERLANPGGFEYGCPFMYTYLDQKVTVEYISAQHNAMQEWLDDRNLKFNDYAWSKLVFYFRSYEFREAIWFKQESDLLAFKLRFNV